MTDAPRPASFRTPDGERLRVIRCGALGAVIRHGVGRRTHSAAELRRYERAVRHVAAKCPAILPARFGTWLDRGELDLVLSTRQQTLRRALRQVRGRAQVTVRIVESAAPPRRPARAAADAAPPAADRVRTPSGREYLRSRARRARADRIIPRFGPARRAVARWIRDERVERHPHISTVYHLIPRSAFEQYRAAMMRAAAAAGLQVIVSGPWPPYAFAEDVG